MNWCLQCMVVASLIHTGHAHLILFHSCLQVIQINNYKKTLPFFWTNKIKLNFSFCGSSVLKRCLLFFRKCKTKLMESLLRLLWTRPGEEVLVQIPVCVSRVLHIVHSRLASDYWRYRMNVVTKLSSSLHVSNWHQLALLL